MLATYTSPRPSLPRSAPCMSVSPSQDHPQRPSLRRQPRFSHKHTASVNLAPGALERPFSGSVANMLANRNAVPTSVACTPVKALGERAKRSPLQVPALRLQQAAPIVSASMETVLFGGGPARDIELDEDIENMSTGILGLYRPFGNPAAKSSPAKGSIFSPRPAHGYNHRHSISVSTEAVGLYQARSKDRPRLQASAARRQVRAGGSGKKPLSSASTAGSTTQSFKTPPRQTRALNGRKALGVARLFRDESSTFGLGDLSIYETGVQRTVIPASGASTASLFSFSPLAAESKPRTLFRTTFQNVVVDFGAGGVGGGVSAASTTVSGIGTSGMEAFDSPPLQGHTSLLRSLPMMRNLTAASASSSRGKGKGKEDISEGWEMDFSYFSDDARMDGLEEFGGKKGKEGRPRRGVGRM